MMRLGQIRKTRLGVNWVSSITPTFTNVAIPDPGLEANYTAGKCDTLSKGGAPNLAQSADVHGGAKAQQFQATGFNDRINWAVNPVSDGFYRFRVWAKRTVGASGTVNCRILSTIVNFLGQTPITSPVYQQYSVSCLCLPGVGVTALYPAIDPGVGPFDTVIVDDVDLYRISLSSCMGPYRFHSSTGNVVIQTRLAPIQGNPIGVMINIDDPANPQNFVLILVDGAQALIIKCVAGTFSSVVTTAIAWVSGDELKVLKDGNQYSIYKNNVQIGITQIINDATIINNVHHTQFSTDPLGVFLSFFTGDLRSQVKFTILGDSIAVAPDRWPYYVGQGYNYGNTILTYHSVSGAHIVENFDGIADLGTQVTSAAGDTPDIIMIEMGTNDADEIAVQTETEAQMNQLKADHPGASIFFVNIFDRALMGGVPEKRLKIAAGCAAAGVECINTDGCINPVTDTTDGLHLNVAGRIKAANWCLARM